ncbi:acyloxyacyl hydrolase [Phycisphaerales bacterium AB-hyl4]|uniref:Acyloxyacyl hydrolase n=1 Tax=Natronomicrosphaera hydrolytica TaxID=3242702 RepID=A0ABV4U4J4_9BACT
MQRIALHAWIAIAALAIATFSQSADACESCNNYQLSLAVQHDDLDHAAREARHEQRPAPFTEGSWTLDAVGFATSDVSPGANADIYGTAIGGSYYFADALAIRLETIGLASYQSGDDAYGGGLGLHGRWHFLQRQNFTLFFEGGGGMIYTNVSLPDGDRARNRDGTHFNFTATMILGLTYQLTENLHLNTGLRYIHISNARRNGKKRNPATEAVGGQLGLTWSF